MLDRLTRVVKSALIEHFFVEFNEEPGIREYFVLNTNSPDSESSLLGIHMAAKVVDRGPLGRGYRERVFDVIVTERIDPFPGPHGDQSTPMSVREERAQ